jgi:membrane protease YdiL (CAAX protease family)
LLLRALEGYMNRWFALILHAFVFEAVHLFVYDLPFQGGGWFVGALVFGYAFQRTRSLAVPVLMHAAHNILVITLAWTAR